MPGVQPLPALPDSVLWPISHMDLNPRFLRANPPNPWRCGEQFSAPPAGGTGSFSHGGSRGAELTPTRPAPPNTRGLERPHVAAMAQRPARHGAHPPPSPPARPAAPPASRGASCWRPRAGAMLCASWAWRSRAAGKPQPPCRAASLPSPPCPLPRPPSRPRRRGRGRAIKSRGKAREAV